MRRKKKMIMDIEQIKSILPHRYPFLFIDSVIELEEEKKIVAIKNVTANEPFFQGHFPDRPIVPGVIIVEALAQASGLLVGRNRRSDDELFFFLGITKAKFRKPVIPGHQLKLEVEVTRPGTHIYQFDGKAFINETELAAQASFSAGVFPKDKAAG